MRWERGTLLPIAPVGIDVRLYEAWTFFRDRSGAVGRAGLAGIALARAERAVAHRGWRVDWEPEAEPYDMGDAETRMPDEVFCAVLRDEDGRVLGSLGMIGDPDRDYRRLVEAELACEALDELEASEAAEAAARLEIALAVALCEAVGTAGSGAKAWATIKGELARLGRI